MSIQQALYFLQAVSGDSAFRNDPNGRELPMDLEGWVALGESMGFKFSIEELRKAFAVDWSMRWAFCQKDRSR